MNTWAIPDDFDFPTAKLRSAWFAYLFGFPNHRSIARDGDTGNVLTDEKNVPVMVRTPIRPLRFITDDLLPRGNSKSKRLKKKLRDDWRPVLKLMHSANRETIANTQLDQIDSKMVEETFKVGVAHLKMKFPVLYDGTGVVRSNFWSIGTWNKHVKAAARIGR